jgi:predicted acetyltransferase
MEVKNLQNDPTQLPKCLHLIEESFSYEEQYSYAEDFKLLINESNYRNCFYLQDNENIVCTVFALPRELIHKSSALPVIFIGGISVNKDYQGQGHFRTLLEAVLSFYSDNALYLLWSDLSSMYEKFNFYEFGLIQEVTGQNTEATLTPISSSAFQDLSNQYNQLSQQFILPRRSKSDWDILKSTSSIQKLTDQENIYFIDKGMDLKNIIHECYPLNINNQTPYTLWSFKESELSNNQARYTGFMRLGNIEVLSTFISSISNQRLSIQRFEDDQLEILFDQDVYHIKPKDFIQGLWGPGRVQEWSDFIPTLIIFGFDSV